jgi:hypothetical protein
MVKWNQACLTGWWIEALAGFESEPSHIEFARSHLDIVIRIIENEATLNTPNLLGAPMKISS